MISRRSLLAGALAGVSLAWAGPAWAAPRRPRLVVVLVRGGWDALSVVPPVGDAAYAAVRAGLALDEALPFDERFGLHPALAAVASWAPEGMLAAVHAVGLPRNERSHFDAQDVLEGGGPRPHALRTGWLGRALGASPCLALGEALPLLLRGGGAAASLEPARPDLGTEDFADQVAALYEDDRLLGPALAEARRVRELVVDEGADGRSGRRADPAARIGALASLMVAPGGPDVGVVEIGGFDTHAQQGTTAGALARRLAGLADGLASLREALGHAWGQTAVLLVSEFGRTARPNGTGGTDHGTAGVCLVAGGALVGAGGGRVLGPWPGLEALHDGRDLAARTDLRAVFKATLHHHLGVDRARVDDVAFPESAGVPILDGLFRPR